MLFSFSKDRKQNVCLKIFFPVKACSLSHQYCSSMIVVLNIISLVICKFQLKDLIFENMFLVRQVQQLFPQLPLNVIIDDLHITRSVDLTIENVLDGLVQTPFQSAPPSPQPTPTTTSPPPITWQHTTTRSVPTVVVG